MSQIAEKITFGRESIVRELTAIGKGDDSFGDPIEPFEVLSHIPEEHSDSFAKLEADLIAGLIDLDSFDELYFKLVKDVRRKMNWHKIEKAIRKGREPEDA